MRTARKLLALVMIAAGGCQLISGVDDLQVTGTGQASSSSGGNSLCDSKDFANTPCGQYCRSMCEQCGDSQYPTNDSCMATCKVFGPAMEDGNTLYCHDRHAKLSACLEAGPAGGRAGMEVCGTNCENFCALATAYCAGVYTVYSECLTYCMGYATEQDFSTEFVPRDTFECRLNFILTAAGSPDKAGEACQAAAYTSVPCDNGQ